MVFQLEDIAIFKKKACRWAASFEVCAYFDANGFTDPYSKFDSLIAAGVKAEVTGQNSNAFGALARFCEQQHHWMTGFLSYDLKNEVEQLHSKNQDHLEFPDLYFFVPLYLIIINGSEASIEAEDANQVYNDINNTDLAPPHENKALNIKARFSRAAYLHTVERIKEHINRGDIYVTNFCQEFYAEEAQIDALDIFKRLNETSPNPFTCFFKYHQKYILCASPERFLAKRDQKLIAQPIKGTAPRGDSAEADEQMKQRLQLSEKERQENVMIVDLVRNDLTRAARAGTVKVEELFGIYSFQQLHQMISTVVCELAENASAVEAIKKSFPMGSMTGAPKVRAMQLMEDYERTKRGIYSGAVGYFSPDGDFDFNVVIRSILYNATRKYLSFQAGSAITSGAQPEQEFEECLLKVKAILQVLGAKITYSDTPV